MIDPKLREAFDEVLATEAGQKVWAHLFGASGYNRADVVLDSQARYDALATAHNGGRRGFYVYMRTLPSYAKVAEVERLAETPAPAEEPQKKKEKNR